MAEAPLLRESCETESCRNFGCENEVGFYYLVQWEAIERF